jgi:hypothetical protein
MCCVWRIIRHTLSIMPQHIPSVGSRIGSIGRRFITMRRAAVVSIIAALVLGVAAPAAAATPATGSTAWETDKRTELFFGGTRPDDTLITPAEFELFLDKEVTPAFPDGLTWLPVHGQWMGGKQDSYLLILLYPDTNQQADRDIEKIRTDYKTQFGQESVLRADSTERVSF